MRSSVWHCQESFLWFSSKKLETLIFVKNAHFPFFCSLNHIFHVQTNFREAHFSQISFNVLFFDVLSFKGGQTSSNEAFSSWKFRQKVLMTKLPFLSVTVKRFLKFLIFQCSIFRCSKFRVETFDGEETSSDEAFSSRKFRQKVLITKFPFFVRDC